jgi:uncharacterized protein YjbI with pentapeptide repeats
MTHHRPHWTKRQVQSLNKAIEDGATIAFTLTGPDGEPCNGGESSQDQYARPGLVQESDGPLRLCEYGVFHATLEPHKWNGSRVWIVALYGEVKCEANTYKLGALKREFIGEVLAHEALDSRIGVKLGRKDLAGSDFKEASLKGASLNGANLTGVNLSGASLSWAYLNETNLSGANLSKTNLRIANLNKANLTGADLSRANLCRASLNKVDLSGAKLHGASLYEADLSGANLSGASLNGASLNCADLGGANLSGADLGDARLSWANLGNWERGPDGFARRRK